jgi:hypothetical protein
MPGPTHPGATIRMIRHTFILVFALTLCGCSLARIQTTIEPTQPWPPATGTVVAQTQYGRITSLDEGGYSIELRETPIPPERGAADHAESMAAIQRHPENTGIVVEVYQSPDTEYMVDILNGYVAYMQSSVGPRPTPGGAVLLPEELESRALQFLTDKNPCFGSALDQLVLEKGGKGDNTFFRWSDPQPDQERPWNQPTFIQVGMAGDGTIFGYVDSGICYLAKP